MHKEVITIHKKTDAFLSNFCPQTFKTIKTMNTNKKSINNKSKSSKVKVTFNPQQCGCLKKIIENDNLLENTEGVIQKDLVKLFDAMKYIKESCYPKNSNKPETPSHSKRQQGGALSFLQRFLGFSIDT